MALQTTTFEWGDYAYKSDSNAYVLQLKLTEESTSIQNNTSSISYELKLLSGIQNRFKESITSTLTLNNIQVATSTETKYLDYSSSWTLISGATTVTHNPDGSLEMPIQVDIQVNNTNKYAPTFSTPYTKEWELTDIPRSTTFDSVTCNSSYFDGTFTLTYTPQSAVFYNKCFVDIINGSQTTPVTYKAYGQKNIVQQSQTLKLTDGDLSTIYNVLPTTTQGTLRFTWKTYSDYSCTTEVGSATVKDIVLTIPESVKPSLGDEDWMYLTPQDDFGVLLQNKNKIVFGYFHAIGGIGSKLQYIKYDVLLNNQIIATRTEVNNGSIAKIVKLGPFRQYGEFKFRCTATDFRGRSISNMGQEPTYVCHEYFSPYISDFNAYRSDADGTPRLNGTYLTCEYTPVYASVDGQNDYTIWIYYNNQMTSGYGNKRIINLDNDTNTTYQVKCEIEDDIGGKYTTQQISVFGQSRILNITKDGTGVAIGKMAESSNKFECRWDAKFDGVLSAQTLSGNLNSDQASIVSLECGDITIVTNEDEKSLWSYIYPIGSIYMSVNAASPATLFGGTWQRIKDCFLLAASDTIDEYKAGQTGGDATHTLTVSEMPSHSHDEKLRATGYNGEKDPWPSYTTPGVGIAFKYNDSDGAAQYYGTGVTIQNSAVVSAYTSTELRGSGQPHNNMPPYLAVYMWQRTE